MSTYFFKTTGERNALESRITVQMDSLVQSKEIENWKIHDQAAEQLVEVESNKLSPEQVKHIIREAGIDVDFTTPPGV